MRHDAHQGKLIIISYLTLGCRYDNNRRYHLPIPLLYVGSIFRFFRRLCGVSNTVSGSFLGLVLQSIARIDSDINRRNQPSFQRHLMSTHKPLEVPRNILHVRGRLLIMINSPFVWSTAALNAQHGIFDTSVSMVLCIILYDLSLRYSWWHVYAPKWANRQRINRISRRVAHSSLTQRHTLGGIYENTV